MTRKKMNVKTGGRHVVGKKDDKVAEKKTSKKSETKPKGKANVS